MEKKSGIYRITNLKNQMVYIGKSIDIETRWKTHKRKLNQGNHINQALQEAWKIYGEESFTFEILIECDESEQGVIELENIFKYSPDVYNVVTWKDILRYELMKKFKRYGLQVDIDYKDNECITPKNNALKWALHLSLNNYEYFIDITSLGKDYEASEQSIEYDQIRDSFISNNNKYGTMKIIYGIHDDENVINEYIKYTRNETIKWFIKKGQSQHLKLW